jgi:hypothetical protein
MINTFMIYTKHCSKCETTKPLDDFSFRTNNGKKYPFFLCKPCAASRARERYDPAAAKNNRKLRPNSHKKYQIANRARRGDPAQRGRFIMEDTRRADKKKGVENDLTRDFVESAIARGCAYCGSHAHMTLDRIDNTFGHTMKNVRPACYRCNLLKADMPEEAWQIIQPAVRAAHEAGLFGDWLITKRKKTQNPFTL